MPPTRGREGSWALGSKCLHDCVGKDVDALADLPGSGAVGRHDHNNVSDRPGENPPLCHGFAHANSSPFAQVEWLPGFPVSHEFKAGYKAGPANVTNCWD